MMKANSNKVNLLTQREFYFEKMGLCNGQHKHFRTRSGCGNVSASREFWSRKHICSFIPKGKDGESKAIVQYLSSGERSFSLINSDAIIHGAIRCDTKDVYFVHNHLSENIAPSPQDIQIYSRLSEGLS